MYGEKIIVSVTHVTSLWSVGNKTVKHYLQLLVQIKLLWYFKIAAYASNKSTNHSLVPFNLLGDQGQENQQNLYKIGIPTWYQLICKYLGGVEYLRRCYNGFTTLDMCTTKFDH